MPVFNWSNDTSLPKTIKISLIPRLDLNIVVRDVWPYYYLHPGSRIGEHCLGKAVL